MRNTFFIIVILLFSYLDTNAQRKSANGNLKKNFIHEYIGNKINPHWINQVTPQNVNGLLNIGVNCNKADLFEINSIPIAWLKDTVITKAAVTMIFIREGKAGTWKSTPDSVYLQIKTKGKNGDPLFIYAKGFLTKGNLKRRIEVQFNSIIPATQYLKTDTH